MPRKKIEERAPVFCGPCRYYSEYDRHGDCCHPKSGYFYNTPITRMRGRYGTTDRNRGNVCPDFEPEPEYDTLPLAEYDTLPLAVRKKPGWFRRMWHSVLWLIGLR